MAELPHRVTVLMPIFNCVDYLDEAVQSILNQTYKSFEFLVIDDGSSDGSLEKVQSFDDPRIKIIKSPSNKGIVDALNQGLDAITTEYIVRMDGDDIAASNRLEEQIKFMDRNPDIGASGTDVIYFNGEREERWWVPTDPEEIKGRLLFHSPLAHPTAIIRTEALVNSGIRYRQKFCAEDWDFWLQCCKKFKLSNLPIPLLRYRYNPDSVSKRNVDRVDRAASEIARGELEFMEIHASEREVQIHRWIGKGAQANTDFGRQEIFDWLVKIQRANKKLAFVAEDVFDDIIFYYASQVAGNRIPDHLAFTKTMALNPQRDLRLKGLLKAARYLTGRARNSSIRSVLRQIAPRSDNKSGP